MPDSSVHVCVPVHVCMCACARVRVYECVNVRGFGIIIWCLSPGLEVIKPTPLTFAMDGDLSGTAY